MDAIAMYSGDLANCVKAFKYNRNAEGWGLILGRLIIGWLERVRPSIDLILGNPTAVDRQPHQHIERILQAAQVEDVSRTWPFVPATEPVLVKPQETAKSAGTGWQAKMTAAQAHANAIQVLRPQRLQGARVLLIDDLFTTGTQFVTVSRLLRASGAIDIRGLVLARAPWR